MQFLKALLGYNLHIINFTDLKGIVQWCLVYSELETIIIFRILSLFQRDPVPNSTYSASGPLFPSLSNHHLLAVCEFAWSVSNI